MGTRPCPRCCTFCVVEMFTTASSSFSASPDTDAGPAAVGACSTAAPGAVCASALIGNAETDAASAARINLAARGLETLGRYIWQTPLSAHHPMQLGPVYGFNRRAAKSIH